jgi:uncharacterized membrane protein YidH (DUF202 family)
MTNQQSDERETAAATRAEETGSVSSDPREESVDTGRIQVLLAEKRTALAALRTGIAIFTLPLSVTTVLITTSRYYNFMQNLHYLIPLFLLCAALVVLGTYLIAVSLIRFRHHGQLIQKIKRKSPQWMELLD